jgi:DNA-binding MarR family transcriptional regulator
MTRLTQQDFERLLEFRVTLRRFQHWSEEQAQAAGLTHVQHQLLVAIKGHPGDRPPTVGDLAGYLLLRSHSTVELVDRAEVAGLVERTPDPDDGRVVRVRMTEAGERILQQLTPAHLDRLHELAAVLDELVTRYDGAPFPSLAWRLTSAIPVFDMARPPHTATGASAHRDHVGASDSAAVRAGSDNPGEGCGEAARLHPRHLSAEVSADMP